VSDETRRTLEKILDDIESGRFAKKWLDEARAGQPKLQERMRTEATHEIEAAGRAVRNIMRRSPDERKKETK
jgi:ketol-acid reductoisomerase